nr:protein mono-ADP-ribosyltransferase PARP12 [Misgurnus anguillicaudatus]
MLKALIIQTICANNGSLDWDDLVSRFGCCEDVVNQNESFAVVVINGRKTVLVRSQVRLCRAQNCGGCAKLHLCKHYLFGSCRFNRGRRTCRFSHDLISGQNSALLTSHGLNMLDRKELCVLLLQNDNGLLPQVCYSYNNGTGEYGRCEQGEDCKRMHICEKYLRGSCECSRAHDFYEPHPLKTLQNRGVPTELMFIMKDLYTNIEALRDLTKNKQPKAANTNGAKNRTRNQKPTDTPNANKGQNKPFQNSTEKTEICMYYIKGFCKHGDSCRKEHSSVPYQWEFRDGSEWKSLPDNEAVEKDYCDPEKSYSSGMPAVSFDTMTRGSQSVRRLSTVSSVIQPTFILTTEWLWYWEDEFGNWIQYATSEGGHTSSSISSAELEQSYQTDNSLVIEFIAGSQTYQLSLKDMIQTNKSYGTKKLVRRRPKFVSAADVHIIKRTKRTPINFKSLPEHWDKSLIPDTGFKRVKLLSSSGEYSKIQKLFNATMRGYTIQQIDRIQNKALWEQFQLQKDHMKKKNGGRDVKENELFHGTDPKYLDAICLNNFDWRICGTHGTAYGKGSYFARDAEYSHNYTKDLGTRCMFVCRILVGDYAKGSSSYLRPPSKDGGDTVFYDSCVNDLYNPTIFVVFEKHQIYPEYLIEYRDSTSHHTQIPAAATRPATVRRPVSAFAYSSNPQPISHTYTTPSHTTPSHASFSSRPNVTSSQASSLYNAPSFTSSSSQSSLYDSSSRRASPSSSSNSGCIIS